MGHIASDFTMTVYITSGKRRYRAAVIVKYYLMDIVKQVTSWSSLWLVKILSYFHFFLFFISETILKLATNISRDKLVSVGTCFGKFTKTIKFRLHITALDFLAPYAKVNNKQEVEAPLTPHCV
jgi:ribosome biogenesis protein Nip4